MKKEKEFDCVEFKRQLQENVRKAFKESGYTDYIKFINDEAKKSPMWGKGINSQQNNSTES
jgi:hypothetical protein